MKTANETSNERKARNQGTQNGFVLGFFVGAILVGGFTAYHIGTELQYYKDQAQKNWNAQAATILYEPAPPLETRVFQGWIEVNGSKLAMPQSAPGLIPRWYIPSKVTPIAYENSGGMQVLYFNTDTRQFDGPYVAKVANSSR